MITGLINARFQRLRIETLFNYFFPTGYGNITPKTPSGQLFTIAYALAGIPLTVLALKSVGQLVNIKRVVPWSAYYFTHDKSYYPVLRQSTPLNAIPKLEHLKARRELNRQEKDLMIEWATNNGKAARQRSVRQETTMFKAGTLPLNMYRTSDYPKDKVSFSHNTKRKLSFLLRPLRLLRLLHRMRPLKMIKW